MFNKDEPPPPTPKKKKNMFLLLKEHHKVHESMLMCESESQGMPMRHGVRLQHVR